MPGVIIKKGDELSDDEIRQISEASLREFEAPLPSRNILTDRFFFLLMNERKILAMGQLIPISPVKLNNEEFNILGIGGIIANEKGKGYGTQIMETIKVKLTEENKTGVGFCKLRNIGFYQKCGFYTDTTSLERFIYIANPKEAGNDENECVFYIDKADTFMEKVLSSDNKVFLPFSPNW